MKLSHIIGKGKGGQKVAEPIKIVANVASAASAAAKLAKALTDAEVQSMIEENQLLKLEKQGLASGYEKEKKALIDQNEKEKKALIDQNAKLKSEIKSLRDYQGDALAGTLLDFKERKEIQVMIQQMSRELSTAIAANKEFAKINQQLVKENTELKEKLAQKDSSSRSPVGSNSNSRASSSNTSPVNQISNETDVGAPPPPPPPPPPPMPPDWKAGAANSKTPPAQGGKIPASNPAALLQAIHDGTPLRKVDAQAPAKEGKTPDRQELLEAIQRGVKLKKVEPAEKPKEKDSTNDLQAVLQKGLAKINAVMGYSTSTADDDWNDTEEEASTTSSVAQETSKITKTPEASAPAINANASTDKKPEATIPAIKAFTDKKPLQKQGSRNAMRIESPQLKIQNSQATQNSQVNLAAEAKQVVQRNGVDKKMVQNVSSKAALPSNTPPASNTSETKGVTELAKKFGGAISTQKRY